MSNEHVGQTSDLAFWLASGAADFDRFLGDELRRRMVDAPERLVEATLYAVLAGGKRLRPYLVMHSAALVEVPLPVARCVAASLECLHCYSLVHDDLPAMDDDDTRRGRPTVHRAFDQATAILVGDALQAMAFEFLCHSDSGLAAPAAMRLTAALAASAGPSGMVGGQMLDLAAEGRFSALASGRDEDAIVRIQSMKTGALFRYAAMSGPLAAGLDGWELSSLRAYGDALGLAFQIRDDLIDTEGDAAIAGKATGKDAGAGKATFVSLLGIDGCRNKLDSVSEAGRAVLAPFGDSAQPLIDILEFNRNRVT